ncbi:MAG: M23 family metallopeptidase [Lachnospiraceae bacterium]|nr:M23 family metallopeptidase [Lachnospiraceae bacterium]
MKTAALTIVIALFFLPVYTPVIAGEDNVFEVILNGNTAGRVRDPGRAADILREARLEAAGQCDGCFFAEAELYIEGRNDDFAHFTPDDELRENMKNILLEGRISHDEPAYSIKVGQVLVSVGSLEDVSCALQNALDMYQTDSRFTVALVRDDERKVNVMTARTVSDNNVTPDEQMPLAGVAAEVKKEPTDAQRAMRGFDGFDYGLKDLYFASKVEVSESYLPDEELMGVDEAAQNLTKLWQEEKVYEVKSGDTLSEIAIETATPLDDLIALNEALEDENSTIREGQELITTSAVPTLSIGRCEEQYYEEDYEAEIEYVYNDDWYTTDKQVLQPPSAGHRKVAARKTFLNDEELTTNILLEEVTYPAVPKIVEVGTKVPPTYIKPISGGRVSSPFGRRKAPKRGASTYHKGIDWATPVGTKVVASSGGVVERAGWGSGYGYVVYINHSDGRQTRYGHLSKVLVKPGEHVSQGQKIALSGNTGRSTGPHIHFELLINGAAVDPMKYLN